MSLFEALKPLKSEIARVQVFPPREGEFGEFTFKNPEINALVEELGFSLYRHQVEALEKLYAGKNIVVTTPTASGKSEIFRLAIFDSYLSDPRKTYILVYPTRALINNQLEKFQRANLTFYRLTGKMVSARILTGDVSWEERRGLLRERPRVVFTTPDILHYNILRRWRDYEWLLRNIRYLVVDELHVYRGIFGSNAAWLFRRLSFRLKRLGVKLQIMALSATLRNPKEFAEKIFRVEFEPVVRATNPLPRRYLVLFEPNNFDDRQLLRAVIERLVSKGIKTLVFFDSRKGTEKTLRFLLNSPVFSKVTTYKGTLPKNVRWEVERDFRDGKLLALLTTNALELGIDIGDLDAVINYGIPPDGLFSLIQRFGRAGRSADREALNGVVLRKNGLDYYYREHFEELVERLEKGIIEYMPVKVDNERIAEKHMHYLLTELGILDWDELDEFERRIAEKLVIERKADLKKNPLTGKLEVRVRRPAFEYSSLRTASDESFFLVKDEPWIRAKLMEKSSLRELLNFINWLKLKGYIIEEVDEDEYHRSLLPGMAYFSRGELYMAKERLSLGKFHFVFADQLNRLWDVETFASKIEEVEILEERAKKSYKGVQIGLGRLRVRHVYTGFAVKGLDTGNYVGELVKLREAGILKGEISSPATGEKVETEEDFSILNWEKFAKVEFEEPYVREFETEGIWLVFPDEIREVSSEEFREFFGRAAEKGFEDLAFHLYQSLDRRKLFPLFLGSTSFVIKKTIGESLQKAGIQDEELAFAIKKMVDSKDGVGSALHAIEHNMIKIAPVFTYVDSRELGGYSYASFPGMPYVGKPVVFIYDGNEGGAGLAEIIYENAEKLMEKSLEHLKSCPCKDGCPVCVLSPKCGTFNEFLDKWAAIRVWERILKEKEADAQDQS
ncbi:DEAD/DEAH box helicase [Thermococcus stetteri]|uniref:DEAD/DEAH box helicase n=1 Tax=Thermococcus stetteri TaxID=49900 RepID=UPI001AE98CA3|nr:DEAD/DEAH box helicase [Thermococcus stetteri]MBP1912744.1 DEAD/DEAH box helicase domain-containing protein [Thermococcus stetteri]